jgi:hypothetical protein
MNVTRRKRRTFQPDLDSLEGRVVLSAAAAVEAASAHAHAVQVQGERQAKHEVMADHHKHKHAPRDVGKFTGGSGTTSGALTITDGTPAQAMSTGSSGATSTATALQVHTLAPNNLGVANLALQGMSVGVETVGTVVSHGRPGPIHTNPTTPVTVTTGTGTGTGTTTTPTTTILSPASGSIGTVTITLPTTGTTTTGTTTTGGVPVVNIPITPGSTVTNNTGGNIPGSGGVTFTTLNP